MAGRGTDIILGGNIEFKVRKQLYNILVSYKNYSKLKLHNSIFPLLKNFLRSSQKFLSILYSLINNDEFLALSDTEILKILNEKIVFVLISYIMLKSFTK